MTNKTFKRIFFIVLLGSLALLLISIPLTHSSSLRYFLYKPGSSFYDFYICLKANVFYDRHTTSMTMYPPLANLVYTFMSAFLSGDTLATLKEWRSLSNIKALQDMGMLFIAYTLVTFSSYFAMTYTMKAGSKKERVIFSLAMFVTVPFLYQIERSNIIIVALVLTMFFFWGKDSEKKCIRELSYIALACSAAIKLYPAIFGIVLLKEKKIKEAIRTAIYGVLALIMPYVFYQGIIDGPKLLVKGLLKEASGVSIARNGSQLGFMNFFKYIFHNAYGYTAYLSMLVFVVFIILALFAVIRLKEYWKVVLLLTILMIGIPSFSYTYVAIFMIIPIILFLDAKEAKRKIDLAYLIGMLLVMIPIPFAWLEAGDDSLYTYTHFTIAQMIECIALVVMLILLIVEGLIPWFSGIRKSIICAAVLAIVIVATGFLLKGKMGQPFAQEDYITKTVRSYIKLDYEGAYAEQSIIAAGNQLDSIILRMRANHGEVARVSVWQNGNQVFADDIVVEKKNGFYLETIDTKDCAITKGAEISVRVELISGKQINIWVVQEHSAKSDSYIYNGDFIAGALGLQIYEKY